MPGQRPSHQAGVRAHVPLDRDAVQRVVSRLRTDPGRASIREMNRLVSAIEQECGVRFVRMEFGIPGLPVPAIAIEAERDALGRQGVGHVYAPFVGIPELKTEAARFVKLFLDVDVPPACCIPTVGAMQGCFASILLASRMREVPGKILFLDPGFPVNKLQVRLLGIDWDHIDFYDFRGDDLVRAIDERASRGDVSGVLWSSPNNPSWISLDDRELRGIGEVCDRHALIAIEDMAYFGMDTRTDYLTPGEPPYQPTVLRHTKRAITLVSSSKIFSYAGQRIALAIVSPELMDAEQPALERYYGTANVGHAFVHGGLYPITASVPESPQYGLLALLRAANDGDKGVFAPAHEYSRRANIMKRLFLDHGFRLVYDNDLGRPLADGFYFTISYPGFDRGADLLRELLHYGISAITLATTGSRRLEGLRACVSMVGDEQFPELQERLERFRTDHPVAG